VALLDAEYFVPFITRALQRAQAGGADPALAAMATPGVVEAVNRLVAWDFTTPTGISKGYDAADLNGTLGVPTASEVSASVAATLYSVWRGQFVRQVIDGTLGGLPTPPDQQAMTALRNLLDQFPVAHGYGASGLNFFANPGVANPEDRRDIAILGAMVTGLARLAGAPFAPAFSNSTDQMDYRWGKLHRVVFSHPIGGVFNTPPAGGAFPEPLPGLPGIPTDGGFGAVDDSNHGARAQSFNDFMFGSGPANRFVAEAEGNRMRAQSAWPGGTSGALGNLFHVNLLPRWLTNDTIRLLFRINDLQQELYSVSKFVPR
jgi:penicillin amidase